MPRAVDAALLGGRQVTVNRDPLKRISYQPPKITLPNVVDLWTPFVEDFLIPIIEGLTGIDLNDPSDWPIWGDLVEITTGLEDGDKTDFGTWANSLLRYARPVPKVVGGAVTDDNPNLLLAPDFRADSTVLIPADSNWSWSNDFGYDSVGCVQVDAAGYLSELVSNEIPVTGGQTVLDMSVKVKWTGASGVPVTLPTTLPTTIGGGVGGLIYTGTNPIVLGVTRYLNRDEVGSDDLAFVASPAATSDWIELFYDTYEVPDDCDEIRLRFKVGANLTSGTVWWDDAAVRPVGIGMFDQIIKGLENEDRPGWNHIDLLLSMFNQFRTTTDHATRITYLETLLSTGNKINDEFLREDPDDLGPNWAVTYIGGAGTWETDGDMAVWGESGISTREARARYIGTPSTTATDTQKVIAVLGGKGQEFLGVESHVDLYGRMDTGETNWIRARFSVISGVTITRCLAGVQTDLAHVDGYNFLLNPTGVRPPGAGATISLVCGTAAGARFFRAEINGNAVLGNDALPVSDATSALGASYRGYGMGVRVEGSLLALGQAKPAPINAWAAIDN